MSALSRAVFLMLLLPVLGAVSPAHARNVELQEDEAVVLVAKRRFHDPLYGETILIARPLGHGLHVGLILNKPTPVTVAELLPDRSRDGNRPLYLGGPADLDAVFALVATHENPGQGALELAPDLYLVYARETLERIGDKDAGNARYFAGAVVWKPGELADELNKGIWHVLAPEPELVLPRQTEGLWQRLVHRAELRDHGI
jgi:putative transcriptional regulator